MPGPYVWKPTPEVIERSNIARFMRRARDRRLPRSGRPVDQRHRVVLERGRRGSRASSSSGRSTRFWTRAGAFPGRAGSSAERSTWPIIASTGMPGPPRRDAHGGHLGRGGRGRSAGSPTPSCTPRPAGSSNALKRLGIGRGDRGRVVPADGSRRRSSPSWRAPRSARSRSRSSPGFGAQAVAARLDDCQAKALITVGCQFPARPRRFPWSRSPPRRPPACPSVRHVIVARAGGGDERPARRRRHLDWDDLVAAESGECPSEPLDPESPLMIAYTSGTTGRPKGAVHVHGGFLVKIAQEVAHQVDMHEDDRLCWVTDLGWIMGPWELVGGLAAGGTVVLAEGAPDYPAPGSALVDRRAARGHDPGGLADLDPRLDEARRSSRSGRTT